MSEKLNLTGILKAIDDLKKQVELIGTKREPFEQMTIQEAIDRGILQVLTPPEEGIDQKEFDEMEAKEVEKLIASGYKYPDILDTPVEELWASVNPKR